MWPTVRAALGQLLQPNTDYRLAGLALTSLTPSAPGLFEQRRAVAVATMDALMARHGPAVIGLGGVTSEDE
jgi:hypothetical protein